MSSTRTRGTRPGLPPTNAHAWREHRGTQDDPETYLASNPPGPKTDYIRVLGALLKLFNDEHATKRKLISFKTKGDRQRFLVSFFRELRRHTPYKNLDPRQLAGRHVQHMVGRWQDRGLATATVHNYLSFLRTFAGWLGKHGMIREPEFYVGKDSPLAHRTQNAVGVDAEVARYSSLFSVWRNQRFSNESEVASLPMRIDSLNRLVHCLEEDARRAERVLTSTDLKAEIDGLPVQGREAIGDALRVAVRRARHAGVRRSSEERVGQVGDLQLWLLVHPDPDEAHVFLRGSAAHDCAAYQTGPALYSELLRVLQGMPDRWKDAAERLESLRKKLQQLQDELRRPFEHQDRLADLLDRQRQLAKELDLDQDEVGSQAVEAEDQALAA